MKKAFALILSVLLTVTWWGGSATEVEQTEYQSGDFSYVLLEAGTAEIAGYRGGAYSLSIPDSLDGYVVTSIGDSAFWDCGFLTSLTIPGSITRIRDSAFYGCDRLTSLVIPDSVTSIGNKALWNCGSLTSLTIPDSVTSIGERAFYGCDSLTSLTIPDSVTNIGEGAFDDCDNLTLTVARNSFAKGYAIENEIPYIYPNANDWLSN